VDKAATFMVGLSANQLFVHTNPLTFIATDSYLIILQSKKLEVKTLKLKFQLIFIGYLSCTYRYGNSQSRK